MKIVAAEEALTRLEEFLLTHPEITVVEREVHQGNYRATNLIIEVQWGREAVCRRFLESQAWEKYLNRGIPGHDLRKGIEPLLGRAEPKICMELILTTPEDLVESELGTSIHEERIMVQRGHSKYGGYIPMNVEFLVESLFAIGFSPKINVDQAPIKLWGRYLPETLSSYIRQLHNLPEHDLIQ